MLQVDHSIVRYQSKRPDDAELREAIKAVADQYEHYYRGEGFGKAIYDEKGNVDVYPYKGDEPPASLELFDPSIQLP